MNAIQAMDNHFLRLIDYFWLWLGLGSPPSLGGLLRCFLGFNYIGNFSKLVIASLPNLFTGMWLIFIQFVL